MQETSAVPTKESATMAIQKLEKFFHGLNPEEQGVISEMVRSALIHASQTFAGADVAAVPGASEAFPIPSYVSGLTGANAPSLIKSLRLPGSLAAHSIPGCNASGLVALRAQFAGR